MSSRVRAGAAVAWVRSLCAWSRLLPTVGQAPNMFAPHSAPPPFPTGTRHQSGKGVGHRIMLLTWVFGVNLSVGCGSIESFLG